MTTANFSSIVPTTELEAINLMLAGNGESAVTSLTNPLPAHVEMAANILRATTRGIQSRGWQFNSVRALTLTPISHADGTHPDEILVPTGAMRIKKTVIDAQRDFDISHREGYLWNNNTNTAKFIAAIFPSGVKVDIVYALDFITLPETARQYIIILAGRRYSEQTVGNPDISGFLRSDESLALSNLIDAEGLAEPTSITDGHKDQRQVNAQFDKVSKDVQSHGWKFNTREDVAVTPVTGTVTLPAGTLSATLSDHSGQSSMNVCQRGTTMYDVLNDTATFVPADLVDGVLYLDLVMYLSDPLTLPAVARRYIEIKTARQLQPQKQPGSSPQGYTERDEFLARQALNDSEGLVDDLRIWTRPTITDRTVGFKA